MKKAEGYYIADEVNHIFSEKFKTLAEAEKEYKEQVEIHAPLCVEDIMHELEAEDCTMTEADIKEDAYSRADNFLSIVKVGRDGNEKIIN